MGDGISAYHVMPCNGDAIVVDTQPELVRFKSLRTGVGGHGPQFGRGVGPRPVTTEILFRKSHRDLV